MNNHLYAVILAGGSGERFWPLSTPARPKQFVTLFGGVPLIRQAVDRLEGLVPPERILVVTAANLVDASAEACGNIPRANIVGEPCRRDTAAACALACGLVAARDPEGVAAILTADQLIGDAPLFRQTLADAAAVAATEGTIVTIGIVPDHPATGFGYIEAGDALETGTATRFHRAARFVEKPAEEKAREYVTSGRFYWNSGMFIWSVRTMAAAVRRSVPELAPLLEAPARAPTPEALAAELAALYPDLPRISVDYAVMERHPDIAMARGAFPWDDVGSWPSAVKHFPADAQGNVAVGDVATMDCNGSLVVSRGGGLVAVLGLDDVIVVQTGTATLVCPKSRAQDLKKLVGQLAERDALKN